MTRSVRTNTYTATLAALVESRKSAGVTQQQLAVLLRKPQSFVSKYENGERRLDIGEFLEIAAALGVEPCRIIRQVMKAGGAKRLKAPATPRLKR